VAKVGRNISEVSEEAVRYVMRYERRQGRNPREVWHSGYDVISSGRRIEVKGKGGPGWDGAVRLQPQVWDVVKRSPNFYVYVVANIDSGVSREYELYIFGKKEIRRFGQLWRGPWVVKIPQTSRMRYRVK